MSSFTFPTHVHNKKTVLSGVIESERRGGKRGRDRNDMERKENDDKLKARGDKLCES